MSDAEVLEFFKRNTVTCGRFSPQQLNRTIGEKKKRNPWSAVLLLPALLFFNKAEAQTAAPGPAIAHYDDSSKLQVRIPLDAFQAYHDTVIVNGSVLDTSDSLVPLAGAAVIFHLDENKTRVCMTDAEGSFSIRLDNVEVGDSVQVEIRYTGYETYFTTIRLQREIELQKIVISADRDVAIVGELPAYPRKQKARHFFWRLFHPRSWFH